MLLQDGKIYVGTSRNPDDSNNKPEYLALPFGNRHGLVTGATGTGKTVTLQVLAEGFSDAGVPVFCADIKGDLSGISQKGEAKDFLQKRADQIGLTPYGFEDFPVIFWDLYGEKGHRVRTTIAEMGPLLLARLMNASEAQEGVLNIAFKIADEAGLALLDLKDLQALLGYLAENASALSGQYGLISKASVGSLQRALLVLEQQGAAGFFGEPALALTDIMRVTRDGRGTISVLTADKLMMNPRLYATFLLWLLSELFEQLPEVGDLDKPKLVFFFDEAHLLFDDAPPMLIQRVEQVVRLIRSKGVGVYFVTQNPMDVPETVLAQLGNRVQHALRAYTPREQRAVKTAAETFRPNPAFDCAAAITTLATGEALVSMLGEKGVPSMVERTLIRPPSGRIGPISDAERQAILQASPLANRYDTDEDRESAYEILKARAQQSAGAGAGSGAGSSPAPSAPEPLDPAAPETDTAATRWRLPGFGEKPAEAEPQPRQKSGYQRETVVEAAMKSVARSVASSVGRALVRGILGSLKR